jgi:protein-disulfide isomerase
MSNVTTYALGGIALVVAVLIVVFVVHWNSGHSLKVREDGYGSVRDSGVQALLDSDGAIVLGKPGAHTVDAFEDPLCPSCGALEHLFGQEISHKIDDGKLAVRYRLVNFLDPKSGSKDYSTRAIAANECVAGTGDGPLYSKFHQLMFTTNQPGENGGDLTNAQIADVAKQAGAPGDVQQCIAKGTRVDTARIHADAALAALKSALGGTIATPTVLDNGKKIDVDTADWVTKIAP